jgi:RNAse (barnase) inhibitor barstar
MQQADESSATNPPRFDLASENGLLLCQARDLHNFFVDRVQAAPTSETFVLAGCSPDDELAKYCSKSRTELGNVDVRVLDDSGRAIGIYGVASVAVTQCRPNAADPTLLDIATIGLLYNHPHPIEKMLWERWRKGLPATRNEWAIYTKDERKAWLEVVRNFSVCTREGADDEQGSSYELDGRYVTDPVSFYCALGEAINGPGGYFGSNLDGLTDCLRGGFGATAPFHLVWSGAKVGRTHLGQPSSLESYSESYLDALLDVFASAGVMVEFQ